MPNASLTILEIAKTSRTRFRLFDTDERNGRPWIENPQVGTYYILDENEGYLSPPVVPFAGVGQSSRFT